MELSSIWCQKCEARQCRCCQSTGMEVQILQIFHGKTGFQIVRIQNGINDVLSLLIPNCWQKNCAPMELQRVYYISIHQQHVMQVKNMQPIKISENLEFEIRCSLHLQLWCGIRWALYVSDILLNIYSKIRNSISTA